jgi:hypothetical protein
VVEVDVDVLVEAPVPVVVAVDVSAGGGAMLVSDVVASVVVSVDVVDWPQAASPTRQATAAAARIGFNMRFS